MYTKTHADKTLLVLQDHQQIKGYTSNTSERILLKAGSRRMCTENEKKGVNKHKARNRRRAFVVTKDASTLHTEESEELNHLPQGMKGVTGNQGRWRRDHL